MPGCKADSVRVFPHVLELIWRSSCSHVTILPESAGIIFAGGFPREPGDDARRAAQRAIFYVQRELKPWPPHPPAVVLCNRGTVDGAAYWPGSTDELWMSVGTTLEEQLGRYDAVIHLRPPSSGHGSFHQDPLRTETAAEAAAIDEQIGDAWHGHPRRYVVEPSADFLDKAARTLEILRGEIQPCCAPSMAIGFEQVGSG